MTWGPLSLVSKYQWDKQNYFVSKLFRRIFSKLNIDLLKHYQANIFTVKNCSDRNSTWKILSVAIEKKYTFNKSATIFFLVQNFHVAFKIVFVSLLSYIHILEQLFSSYPKIANIVPYFRNDWAITRSKKIEVNGAGTVKYKLMGDQ